MSERAMGPRTRSDPARTRRVSRWLAVKGSLLAVAALAALTACRPGGSPAERAPLLPPPQGVTLEPGPPDDLYWLRFVAARVPAKTPGGLSWDDDHGLPDPYAVLLVDGVRLLESGTQNDTLTPTWPRGPGGNFRLPAGRPARVALYDRDTLRDQPISAEVIRALSSSDAVRGYRDVDLGSVHVSGAAKVRLAVERAHAMFGLGFTYRRTGASYHVVGLYQHGPGSRAGLREGDELVRIGERPVAEMSPAEVKSWFNAVPAAGLSLTVLHDDGASENVNVNLGPVYPLFSEYGPIP